jgi:GTPase-associated protein 1, N-terminal domain type 2/GTPase-associated protein 1, C-terminal domain/GTPase-associated protein 1, middle domain
VAAVEGPHGARHSEALTVAFQQLYYTSCERGVAGYAGFQFNALSPGAGTRVMREVERLTVYELPSWDSSPADAPVNLCHAADAARGSTITANVVYAGADFSGRAGNYFAHALVTDDPDRDFGGLLPVELWESPVWARAEADSTTLPTIAAALPRGSFDRPTVAAFLGARADAGIVLARLLSAVDVVMREGRSLILWTSTSTENAYWIAAVSYLMQAERAREMSFYTYTRRPAQCRAHVIGTVPGTVTSAAALADSFRVFDLTAHTMPDMDVHPLAELLAQVGVLRAAGLWRQAATLAEGRERTLDEWYPVASAAAALLGIEPLPSGAVAAMAGWLGQVPTRSVPLAAPHIENVLTVLIDRPDELADDQLRPLLSAAKAAGAVGQQQRLELMLVNRAMTQLELGRPPEAPTRLETVEGIRLAVAGCEGLLGPANAPAVMTVLDWARQAALGLDSRLVERCGVVVGRALPAVEGDRRVVLIGRAYPAFARGLGEYLAGAGTETAERLLRGVAGELLDSSDLSANPELREIILIHDVRSGQLPPIMALREIIELRASPDDVFGDARLLARLWPEGLLTVSEASVLLSLVGEEAPPTPAVDLLNRPLQGIGVVGDVDAWLDLCGQTLQHPVGAQLPAATRQMLKALRGIEATLDDARRRVKLHDMDWYPVLHDRVEALPRGTGEPLRQQLGYLTTFAPRPAEQLGACSWPVFDAVCDQAKAQLGTRPLDHQLAARLFLAVYELRASDSRRAQRLETRVLAPVIPGWPRRDRRRTAARLKWQGRRGPLKTLVMPSNDVLGKQRLPDLSRDFKAWCKNARSGPE